MSLALRSLFLVLLVCSSIPLHAGVPLPEPDRTLTRIAFGSCALQWVPQPVFRAVAGSRPDLYLSLGDAIYADYDGESVYPVTPESLKKEWEILSRHPDWSYMASRVPVMATWDNHDYGHHSAGREFPLKSESKQVFLDFLGEPHDSERRTREGVYTAKTFGPEGRRTQVILLDTRSFKSMPRLAERDSRAKGSLGKFLPVLADDATLLGKEQWSWLLSQLQNPAQLRLIGSSGQVIPDQKGMDEWGNYPLERERLLQMLAKARGLTLILSGNVHFSEISSIDTRQGSLSEFTSSGLTHVNADYAAAQNDYRVAGPAVEENFGLIDIEWNEGPSLSLSVLNKDSRLLFRHKLD